MILVVGSTGQLGAAVVRRLQAAGRPVRAFVEPRYRAQQLALRPLSQAASNLMGLSWINAQFGTPFETAETRRIFDVEPTTLHDFLARRVRADDRRAWTSGFKAREISRLRARPLAIAWRSMTRPASIAATTRCFCSSISDDRVRLDGQLARLTGRFRFTRSAGTAGPIRRFDAVSLWLVDARGASYRIIGADQAAVGAPSAAGFRRIHRGVLVGSGALNNRPLTLLLEFTELPDGTATSELIAARVDLP